MIDKELIRLAVFKADRKYPFTVGALTFVLTKTASHENHSASISLSVSEVSPELADKEAHAEKILCGNVGLLGYSADLSKDCPESEAPLFSLTQLQWFGLHQSSNPNKSLKMLEMTSLITEVFTEVWRTAEQERKRFHKVAQKIHQEAKDIQNEHRNNLVAMMIPISPERAETMANTLHEHGGELTTYIVGRHALVMQDEDKFMGQTFTSTKHPSRTVFRHNKKVISKDEVIKRLSNMLMAPENHNIPKSLFR